MADHMEVELRPEQQVDEIQVGIVRVEWHGLDPNRRPDLRF